MGGRTGRDRRGSCGWRREGPTRLEIWAVMGPHSLQSTGSPGEFGHVLPQGQESARAILGNGLMDPVDFFSVLIQ